jgi:hypothetical protein
MQLRDWLYYKWQGMRRRLGLPVPQYIAPFELSDLRGIQKRSDLAKLFFAHDGRTIHKWVHYLDLYERYFAPLKSGPVTLLEIGVFKGGSLQLWRRYFGPGATIYGIDIDPACAEMADPPTQIRIGSQADPLFLRSVVEEMGRPNIVLDDGSHVAQHQRVSFETLFSLLQPGGLYIIEDTQTAYWPGQHEGGYGRAGTAIELVKRLVDDLHGWWHNQPGIVEKHDIAGIHVHDSIVFIEKGPTQRPGHIKVGGS